jgi:hypothetical protein
MSCPRWPHRWKNRASQRRLPERIAGRRREWTICKEDKRSWAECVNARRQGEAAMACTCGALQPRRVLGTAAVVSGDLA